MKKEVKNYTSADVDNSGTYTRLHIWQRDFISKALPHHIAGRSYTSSGYGRKIPTSQCIMFNGKLRRVYCCCYSNSGVAYITGGGNWNGNIIIDN